MLYLKCPQRKNASLWCCAGALRIQRLEGSRPAIGDGLWVLYVGQRVLMVGDITVGVYASRLASEIALTGVARKCFADCGEEAIIAAWAT